MIAFSSTSSIGIEVRWIRDRLASGRSDHARPALGEHGGPLGVVVHCGYVRTGEHQVGVVGTVDGHRGERLDHAGHVLEPVPPTDLEHQRDVGRWRRAVRHQAGAAAHGAGRPVSPLEADRPVGRRAVEQTDGRQHEADGRRIDLAVLRRERVDRRRDHREPLPVEPGGWVLTPREDEGVGLLDVGPEERPPQFGLLVGVVAPDVAAPHDSGAGGPHTIDHAGGLRVVEHNDVARR